MGPHWMPWLVEVRLRLKSDGGGAIIEFHMCFIVCPKCWCTSNELGESWGVKINLIEESYFKCFELGGVDEGYKVL